jgi:S-adenosylmethionine:tRNA ribosyltransferase-isomerase
MNDQGEGEREVAGANLPVSNRVSAGGLALASDRDAGRRLEAASPAEWRGLDRDEVKLLVSDAAGHRHARFHDLAEFLRAGDLLVVNESATLPASLDARGRVGRFVLNLSTRFEPGLWLAEPRWSAERPGPLPLRPGDRIVAAGVTGRLTVPFAGSRRLWFVAFDGDIDAAMSRHGVPIRYGYLRPPWPPLRMYQTIFARIPGSAEMPSAGRPFSRRLVTRLQRRGVRIASVVLHTGVSSLEAGPATPAAALAYPEPFRVPAGTAELVNRTRARGGRVVAAGTTVVRAVESATDGDGVRAAAGFTRLLLSPARPPRIVDGLITGFHDAGSTHVDLLVSVAGEDIVMSGYEEAVRGEYLWHEFGDAHLLWRSDQ